jgi:membrane fusion protein, multidrug efflux system
MIDVSPAKERNLAADNPLWRRVLGRVVGMLIVLGAVGVGYTVWSQVTRNPQTDDAEVFANLIGIAPEVSGRIVAIPVRDNQLVRKGDVLFEIDPVPFEYALETAQSQQHALDGQIRDLQRSIGAQTSAVASAKAGTKSAQARIESRAAAVQAALAGVEAAKAELSRAEADSAYAENNLLRLEPLLKKQFVTADLVDQARTSQTVKSKAVQQARARLALAEAEWASAVAQQHDSEAAAEQSNAQLEQSARSVAIPDPLIAQREARAAAVKNAEYDLARCKVYAPFDARVTNLTISEGAYAHAGQQAFTLIDTRTWWVIANFRETELRQLKPGLKADVFVMPAGGAKFEGTVDSVGFGVTPDLSLVGSISQGLPDVQRSLNWVHLAARFPVRIRVSSPSPEAFRIGASAMVVVHEDAAHAGNDKENSSRAAVR